MDINNMATCFAPSLFHSTNQHGVSADDSLVGQGCWDRNGSANSKKGQTMPLHHSHPHSTMHRNVYQTSSNSADYVREATEMKDHKATKECLVCLITNANLVFQVSHHPVEQKLFNWNLLKWNDLNISILNPIASVTFNRSPPSHCRFQMKCLEQHLTLSTLDRSNQISPTCWPIKTTSCLHSSRTPSVPLSMLVWAFWWQIILLLFLFSLIFFFFENKNCVFMFRVVQL